MKFALSDKGMSDVKEADYVVLPKDALALVQKRVDDQTLGSVFTSAGPGTSITQVLSKK